MNIRYKKYPYDRTVNKTIFDLIENASQDYDYGKLQIIENKVEKSIELTESLIDILYVKGILDDTDIKTLIRSFLSCDEDTIQIQKDNNHG